jgi:hypothetical protein
MRKLLLISLVVLCLVLSGCSMIEDYLTDYINSDSGSDVQGVPINQNSGTGTTGTDAGAGTDTSTSSGTDTGTGTTGTTGTTALEDGCKHNQDCPAGELCIDSDCGKIADLYVTEGCTKKCNFKDAVVETSDGQTFTLNRGKGDYTAAGAIEWKLATGPDYCPGDNIIVPVSLKKKYSGEIVNEQYVKVNVSQKSAVITHPNMTSVKFTFTVKSVKEECS